MKSGSYLAVSCSIWPRMAGRGGMPMSRISIFIRDSIASEFEFGDSSGGRESMADGGLVIILALYSRPGSGGRSWGRFVPLRRKILASQSIPKLGGRFAIERLSGW